MFSGAAVDEVIGGIPRLWALPQDRGQGKQGCVCERQEGSGGEKRHLARFQVTKTNNH